MAPLIIRDVIIIAFGAVIATWCADRVLLLFGFP
jgi:hypothetical protein